MVSSQLTSIPSRPGAGTRFGWSFLSAWSDCPMQAYTRYIRPHPSGGTGCEPRHTGKALLLGGILHKGLERYYLSGGVDPLDAALEAAIEESVARTDEFDSPDTQQDVEVEAVSLLRQYHQHWGPGGIDPEFPRYKIATDSNGKSMVEHDLEIDLGYGEKDCTRCSDPPFDASTISTTGGRTVVESESESGRPILIRCPDCNGTGRTPGYIFTTRIDALCWYEDRYLVDLEHKSWDTSWIGRYKRQWERHPQGTGQLLCIQSAWPDVPTGGVHLNILRKRAGKDLLEAGRAFERHPVSRQPIDFEVFRNNTVRKLKRIDELLEEYHHLVSTGMDHNEAARLVFDSTPSADRCQGNFACPYLDSCLAMGEEERWFELRSRARTEGLEPERRGTRS